MLPGKENPLPSCSVTIKIPGLVGAAGGETSASDAAIPLLEPVLVLALAELVVGVGSSGAGESGLMVDVEEDLPKPLVRGAKCVSLSFLVSFQDIVLPERGSVFVYQ